MLILTFATMDFKGPAYNCPEAVRPIYSVVEMTALVCSVLHFTALQCRAVQWWTAFQDQAQDYTI